MIGGWSSYSKNVPKFSKDIDSTTAIFNFPAELITTQADGLDTESGRKKAREKVGEVSGKRSGKIMIKNNLLWLYLLLIIS